MTLREAQDAISRARALKLSGAEFIATLGDENVMRAYNGIGPEWLPASIRAKLDKWLDTFSIGAVIHDCRFVYDNDGEDAKFRAANDELERNCLIVADATYAWYNPVRYLARWRGRHIAEACRDFGWGAWRDAYEANCGYGKASNNLKKGTTK